MIHEVTGDILLSRAAAIAHGVAPDDHFSSGLALALRERWPAMVKDFRHWCHVSHPKPGGAWTWAGAQGPRIVNLLTQEPAASHGQHPGKATPENVNHALRELRRIAQAEGLSSIALPRIATGVGGLEWSTIAPLITRHLGDLEIPVVVYTTFHAGQAAEEPL